MTTGKARALALALILALPASAVLAQGAQIAFGGVRQDTSAPVEVASDALSVDQTDGTAVFKGNVEIAQGEMRLSAAEVRVVYAADSQRISRLQASGGVTLVSGPDAAEAATADYDIDSGRIVMEGDVLLVQGNSTLAAQRMTVDTVAGTAEMEGRVRTVLQPSE